MSTATSSAIALARTASTYDGFYLRNNLGCDGTVPSSGPYDLCPDVIGSTTPIANAQSALSTPQSWGATYDTGPVPGAVNYYYVRGLNGASTPADSRVELYRAPSQLILFPDSWSGNGLATASGCSSVSVTADPGHIGVGDDAFVWTPPADLGADGSYASFVARVTDAQGSNPIPTITSWLDMGKLLTQQLGFGFRNTSYVDATAQGWYRRLGLSIPDTLQQSGTLLISLTSTGFVGATLGLIADRFTGSRKPLLIQPFQVTQNGGATAITALVDPGFSTDLAVQYWRTGGTPPAPGSTINLSVDYVVPSTQVADAVAAGLVDGVRSRYLQEVAPIGPQAMVPLGSATFIVGDGGVNR